MDTKRKQKRKPSWTLRSKSGRDRWNAVWYVDPRGYSWKWEGVRPTHGYRLPYRPELSCISGEPTDDVMLDHDGPWLIAHERRKLVKRPEECHYDPLNHRNLDEKVTDSRARPRIHRRFAELGSDHDKILGFVNRYGFLGERGMNAAIDDYQGYVESYTVWCQEILMMRQLCTWWDHVKYPSERSRKALLEWFNPHAQPLDYVRHSTWESNIPDLRARYLNMQVSPSPRLPESKTIVLPHPYALQAASKLTREVPVTEQAVRRYEQLGEPCPESWIQAALQPDIIAIAGHTINEIVNHRLELTCRVAIQFSPGTGAALKPDQAYYVIAETLLGAIYRSFVGEMLGVVPQERECPYCETAFVQRRSDQIFCCDHHRIAHSQRLRRAAAKAGGQVQI